MVCKDQILDFLNLDCIVSNRYQNKHWTENLIFNSSTVCSVGALQETSAWKVEGHDEI